MKIKRSIVAGVNELVNMPKKTDTMKFLLYKDKKGSLSNIQENLSLSNTKDSTLQRAPKDIILPFYPKHNKYLMNGRFK